MNFESVLGYSDNSLILEYQEKYFEKLVSIFNGLDISEEMISKFLKTSKIEQKYFLLHPDISSLLQSIKFFNNEKSLSKLKDEVNFFLKGEKEKLTLSKGQSISGTNIKLTEIDNNPENSHVGHPDHDQEGMLGWGKRNEQEWLDVFEKSFHLLKNVNRDFFDELNYIIKKIVPMKTSIDVHNSCSYKECVGTLYLGYTINAKNPELNILEALIHESSHNKLSLIMQSERLHLNDYDLKYYSPYRPDARHIHGVLLGVHAIVPTVYVMLQAMEQGFISDTIWYEKILIYHIKNKLGYRVLQKYANFTLVGSKIFKDLGKVIQMCDEKIQKNKTLQDIDTKYIQLRVKEHFIQVQQEYSHLQY